MNLFELYGNAAHTDKTMHHGYHRFYDSILQPLRSQSFGMIEIGIETGASLNLWKNFFPSAFIYGIDIGNSYEDDRCKIFTCDQSDLSALHGIKTEITKAIKFINDDGSHIPEHQLLSFNFLFNNVLEDGGIYIIEDIETSYWKKGGLYGYKTKYGLGHPNSVVEKMKNIVDWINGEFITTDEKEILDQKTDFLDIETKMSISSVTFVHNAIIIKKKEKYEHKYDGRTYRFYDNIALN